LFLLLLIMLWWRKCLLTRLYIHQWVWRIVEVGSSSLVVSHTVLASLSCVRAWTVCVLLSQIFDILVHLSRFASLWVEAVDLSDCEIYLINTFETRAWTRRHVVLRESSVCHAVKSIIIVSSIRSKSSCCRLILQVCMWHALCRDDWWPQPLGYAARLLQTVDCALRIEADCYHSRYRLAPLTLMLITLPQTYYWFQYCDCIASELNTMY